MAALMGVADALMAAYALGWRPRRTIVFASWDAEEYALVGSVEYVEKEYRRLVSHGVAYLNMDIAVFSMGELSVSASPLLWSTTYKVAQMIEQPQCYADTPQMADLLCGTMRVTYVLLC
jgi:N-acetylated-alpha-linked acidic dipeptidase